MNTDFTATSAIILLSAINIYSIVLILNHMLANFHKEVLHAASPHMGLWVLRSETHDLEICMSFQTQVKTDCPIPNIVLFPVTGTYSMTTKKAKSQGSQPGFHSFNLNHQVSNHCFIRWQ